MEVIKYDFFFLQHKSRSFCESCEWEWNCLSRIWLEGISLQSNVVVQVVLSLKSRGYKRIIETQRSWEDIKSHLANDFTQFQLLFFLNLVWEWIMRKVTGFQLLIPLLHYPVFSCVLCVVLLLYIKLTCAVNFINTILA